MNPVQSRDRFRNAQIAVVIPCFKVRSTIAEVIGRIGPEVSQVICVDDGCPEDSGTFIENSFGDDSRVRVIRHLENLGVGAATCTGYTAAIALGASVIVKIDGDGQMDPGFIPDFCSPITNGEADYVKGNRFFDVETVRSMPRVRLIGNAVLSLLTKFSSGYWDLFDPANGFTAIAAPVARVLPLSKLHQRYFFESDMLFRLGTIRARVIELPMSAKYGAEQSNLSEAHSAVVFPILHLRNAIKRVVYSYFLRGFSIASLYLVTGISLFAFGVAFGAASWMQSRAAGVLATPGTVMLAALPILMGLQLMLAFLAYDVSMVPKTPIHTKLRSVTVLRPGGRMPGE